MSFKSTGSLLSLPLSSTWILIHYYSIYVVYMAYDESWPTTSRSNTWKCITSFKLPLSR